MIFSGGNHNFYFLFQISLTIAGYKKSRRSVEIQNDLPYARDDEEFLKLVPETYDEADLVEWEPAPPPISKPDEPGDLGKTYLCKL